MTQSELSREFQVEYRTSDLLSVLAYDEDSKLFVMEDGFAGFGFLSDPISGIDSSVSEKLNVLMSQDFPEGTFISISLFASPNIEEFLTDMTKIRRAHLNKEESGSELLRESFENEVKFLNHGTKTSIEKWSHTMIRDFIVIFTVKIPIDSALPSPTEIRNLAEHRLTIKPMLKECGLFPRDLVQENYIRLMSSIINWSDRPSWKEKRTLYSEKRFIKDQIFDYETKINIHPNHIELGNKTIKVFSVKRMPDYVSLANVVRYFGDPRNGSRGVKDNILVTLNICVPNAENIRASLQTKRQATNYQAFGPISKWVPKINHLKQSFDALYHCIDNGDKVLKAYLSFCIFSNTPEAARAASSNFRSFISEIGMQVQEDINFVGPLFLNSLPFGAEKTAVTMSDRYKTMSTSQAVQLMPVVGDSKGTGTPTVTLVSRNGQPMGIDLYDSRTNYNAVIAATTGAGKSFLTNQIIMSYLTQGAKTWVIDIGRSYEKLTNILNGDFIEFSSKSNICLNPFDLVKDYKEDADMLVGLVTAMAAPSQQLTDLQSSRLQEIMRECWEKHKNDLNIDIIQDALKAIDDDQRIRDIGFQLSPFTSKGEYGTYFNGKNNIDFSNRLTVLELEELKGRPRLQQVVLLQLIYQIQKVMDDKSNRNQKKLLIIDESWALLTQGQVGKYIEASYRKFRKYNGSAITVTQSVNDLYKSDSGIAIVENSAHMYLLAQKPETVEMLRKDGKLAIPNVGYDLLKTIHTQPGQYSEVLVYSNGGLGVGRLIVNRFSQLVYSTAPQEVAGLNARVSKGMTITQAINDYIKEEEASNG